jgi:hypothetical protein
MTHLRTGLGIAQEPLHRPAEDPSAVGLAKERADASWDEVEHGALSGGV